MLFFTTILKLDSTHQNDFAPPADSSASVIFENGYGSTFESSSVTTVKSLRTLSGANCHAFNENFIFSMGQPLKNRS